MLLDSHEATSALRENGYSMTALRHVVLSNQIVCDPLVSQVVHSFLVTVLTHADVFPSFYGCLT